MSNPTTPWYTGVRTGIVGPVAAGMAILMTGFGGFAAWAAMAPVEGAIIVQGKVVVSGRNKIVQHLEGGIVREILVEEGQTVGAGEPVLVLDGAAARSHYNRLKVQLATLGTIAVRASAERNGATKLDFSSAVDGHPKVQWATLIEDQEAEFSAGLQKHQAELRMLDQQIAALEEQIAGHALQKDATNLQIDLIAEERQSFEDLLEKGLTRKNHVLALRRSEADLQGRYGQIGAAIAHAEQSIGEIRERIIQTKSTRVREASAQLSQVRAEQASVAEQLNSAEEVTKRLVVRAPAAGTIIQLTKYNSGAVIDAGQEIMTIVPQGAALVVEARVRPQDINDITVGQEAWMKFTSFDPQETPAVAAKVVYISADRLEEPRTGEGYYLTRLEISGGAAPALNATTISPGLAAEVYITTESRTLLEFISAPITRTLTRSFRES